MDAVEWTRLEGGQVEAVIAMFVNREHPSSIRITPSRGDGGVDILDRGAGPDASDVVYQVKRYTEKLTAKQKRDIKGSLDALATDERWKDDLDVKEWHLVTPWDPTPEAETWLQSLGDQTVTKIWQGLTWADQQAAKYPDVVDYYLHGGRARIEATYAEVMSLMSAENVDTGLTVPKVADRLQAAIKTLDHDPHYRYEFRFGEGQPPVPATISRPGLVMHCLAADKSSGHWTTVDIIARCAASTDERPITIKGTVTAKKGSEFADELEAFFTYGAPLTSPAGAFEGEVDAPGGLGGALTGATIRLGPAADRDLGPNPEFYLEVIGPLGNTLGAVNIRRVDRSQGIKGGARVVLQEDHGLFEIEDRYDTPTSGHRSVTVGSPTGKPVGVAHAAMQVVGALHAPNSLRISRRHTPPNRGIKDVNIGFEWDPEARTHVASVARVLHTLTTIQNHASDLILTPEFADVPREQFEVWRRAAAMLEGVELAGTYPEGECIIAGLDADVTPVPEEDLRILMPFKVEVGTQIVDLGHYEIVLPSPTLVERRDHEGRTYHIFTTPDGKMRYRHHASSGPDAG